MKKLTAMRAIRAKCIDCCAGQRSEIAKCPSTQCPLWGYRSGHLKKGTELPFIDMATYKPGKEGGLTWLK